MHDLLAQAAARAITYYAERDGWSVFPDSHAMEALQHFIEALPAEGTDGQEVIRVLDEVGGPGTVASTGGRYFGFVTGSAHPVGVAASWLAAAWDQNAAMGVMSPTAAVLDTVAGAWLTTLFGLPAGTQTTFVAGTSVGNVTCLAAGRDKLFAVQGWDSVNDGLIGAPPLRVVVSDASHS
ncbi:MAG: aspartate aminotransferase family protein, partial [Acidimicrobiia bacterium]|nr:aspartate aminotransferase family protein [Acidimicrobiia bacterium]